MEQILSPRDGLQIGSGAERFTGARDHHRTNVRVVLSLLQRITHRRAHRAVDRVARLGRLSVMTRTLPRHSVRATGNPTLTGDVAAVRQMLPGVWGDSSS
jgi:hypothetical protein